MLNTAHALPEELLLYASGALAGAAAELLADHMDRCEECFLAVVLHREIQDLESLGVLLAAAPVVLQRQAAPKAAAGRSKGPGIAGAIGGILTGVGLAGSLAHQPVPGLAGNFDDHLHNDVRTDPNHPSYTSEGPHSEGGDQMAHTGSGYGEATHNFGLPASEHTSGYVHQSYADTCAVQCQHLILDSFGIHVTEDQLVKEAEAKGIYAPGQGTRLEDVGKLLEAHGLAVHREMNANVFNLATELSQGHQVIVGLDSGELWHENSILQSIADAMGIGSADHAVIVSGIDTTDPDHVKVIVTDPGTGDVAKEYPLNEFLEAWHTSQFSMVATSEPVPSWHPEMVNFDYQTGHLATVGGAPYEFAHELNTATTHETDGSLMGRLESLFLSVVDGDVSMNDVFHGLGHFGGMEHHGTMPGLVSELLSLGHAGMLTGAIAALLEPTETYSGPSMESSAPTFGHENHDTYSHDDALLEHGDIGHELDTGHHHDVSHADSGEADHHHDDPLDPHGWHHQD
jgi:hypothetical protein